MKRIATKLIAGLTLVAFTTIACTQQATETAEEKTITVAVSTQVEGKLESVGSSEMSLASLELERIVILDGVEQAANVMKIAAGKTFTVPLNTGERATVKRTSDGIELVSFTGPQEDIAEQLPRGAVTSIRMHAAKFELFLRDSKSTTADTVIEVGGLEAGDQRELVVGALALQSLLISLEDTEQLNPVVAIALIAAAVTAVWFTTCGSFAAYCAYKCWAWPNQETQCAGLTVKSGNSGLDITLGGGYSCRCTW